jgi:hypothetical protein
MEQAFTEIIKTVLKKHFGEQSEEVFENSQLLQYLNQKTKSANRGAKARGSFANLYAIYVLVEDYLANNFQNRKGEYADYEGALYTKLLQRQRELPFGNKLQNHALITTRYETAIKQGYLNEILSEIIKQSKIEFNYEEEETEK